MRTGWPRRATRGKKVIAVAPDYADNVKFADEWLAPAPGTDGALAMAMGHVTLKEFFVDLVTPHFDDYGKRYTDLPLPGQPRAARRHVRPWQVLTASDLGDLLIPGYYDGALRDFGLLVAAVALARLAGAFRSPAARVAAAQQS